MKTVDFSEIVEAPAIKKMVIGGLVHLKFSEPRNVEYNEVFLLICDVHEF